jgi:hypothetical protein
MSGILTPTSGLIITPDTTPLSSTLSSEPLLIDGNKTTSIGLDVMFDSFG